MLAAIACTNDPLSVFGSIEVEPLFVPKDGGAVADVGLVLRVALEVKEAQNFPAYWSNSNIKRSTRSAWHSCQEK